MKSLEERMAEISRRSERIIRQRKKHRKHILTACLPLCLCVFAMAAVLLVGPEIEDGGTEAVNECLGSAVGSDQDGAEAFAGSVEMAGPEGVRYYSSVETVSEIMEILYQIISVPETANEDYGLAAGTSVYGADMINESGYTITVNRMDGTVSQYCLRDSLLVDQSTGEEYALTEEQMGDLQAIFDIP